MFRGTASITAYANGYALSIVCDCGYHPNQTSDVHLGSRSMFRIEVDDEGVL